MSIARGIVADRDEPTLFPPEVRGPTTEPGLRVLLGARSTEGKHVPLADTGAFDWVVRLASNARQRFVASGLGLQLLPILFRSPSG